MLFSPNFGFTLNILSNQDNIFFDVWIDSKLLIQILWKERDGVWFLWALMEEITHE